MSTTKVNTTDKWLDEGYRQFADVGPENLSIKQISKVIGMSRASFYHHFGDIEIFIEELLNRHWNIVKDFNEIGKSTCNQLFPDLYNLLAEYTVPLQFNIQLFHHRSKPEFNYLFLKGYESSAKTFLLQLFADQYSLHEKKYEIYNLWLTVGEAWYSRLNNDDLSSSTLQRHAEEIIDAVVKFADSRLYSTMKV